jgi:catechol 2,3-dioxygenase-like lactoylglutathione lyase family enzyme
MEGFVAHKLDEFEHGKISRRRLIEALTLAATAAGASEHANAEGSAPALQVALVNHISYTCPDFHKAADWYSKVFNLDQVGNSKSNVVLPFGKRGEQPYNVEAKDVPLTHLVIRTRDPNRPPESGLPARPKSQAVIDHICYTIADFDRDRVRAELKSLGIEPAREPGPRNVFVRDPFGFYVQISGLASNALTDRAGQP